MRIETARRYIGHRVFYAAVAAGIHQPQGKIESVGEIYVHVRYDGDSGTKATCPEDLYFVDMIVLDEADS